MFKTKLVCTSVSSFPVVISFGSAGQLQPVNTSLGSGPRNGNFLNGPKIVSE